MKEKTKKMKKTVAAAVSVALIAAVVIGGSFAYLQGTSDDVVNTFSTNKVNVSLIETTGKDYNIIPGTSQEKNPKVTVNATVNSYVYVEVNDETQGLVTWEIAEGWTKLDGFDNVYYREFVPGDGKDTATYDVLKSNQVSYAASLTNDDMLDGEGNLKTGIKLTFQAFAIQQEGFATPKYGWQQIPSTSVSDGEDLNTALKAGGNIVLDEDMTAQEWTDEDDGSTYTFINVNSPSNIDLNDNSLKADWINIYDDVTIENGVLTVDNAETFLVETENTTVTLKNVELKASEELDGIALVGGADGITYILEDVTTDEDISGSGAAIVINSGNYNGSIRGASEINGGTFAGDVVVEKTEINDGEIKGTISTLGNNWTLEINDGKFAKTSLIDTVNDGTGTITINGGTFKCTQILDENKSFGHLYINGGTFTEKLTINTTYASVIDISDGEFEGLNLTGIAYSPITISGGTFGTFSVSDNAKTKPTITGGTFGSDPTSYLKEGYKADQNEDNTWTVVKESN